ncbi:family 16 glycosylhydrolase [Streptomyces sp. NPDC058221]|uniref:glycoside hydrolase family 16 protein n=1 Tax=Streptomyces sp. NPDC058221 TaxID=3346388 RepID=UPI0036E8F1BB
MTTKRRVLSAIAVVAAGSLGMCLMPAASQAAQSTDTAALAASVDPATPLTAKPVGTTAQSGKLVFSDEFNGTAVDASKWVKGDGERQAHSGIRWWYKPENVGVANGSLNLSISKLADNQYAGSSVSSQGLFAYKYGTIEFRMQAPPTEGHLGAVWMMPENGLAEDNNGSASDGAEYDLAETSNKADTYPNTVHYDGYGTNHKSTSHVVQAPGLHSGYHTFSLVWTPESLTYLYDGTMVRYLTDTKLISAVRERPVMSNEILQMAEGDIATAPKNSTSDAKFDYVRVWQNN